MDDTQGAAADADPATARWSAYVEWAIGRAGSIKELAARSRLHRTTISDWRGRRSTPATLTVKSIRAIAEAVGDDPRNAMRAAGRDVAAEPASLRAAAVELPTLADQLARINDRIDRILASGLPLPEQLAEVETQQALADRLVTFYAERVEPPTDRPDEGGGVPRSA